MNKEVIGANLLRIRQVKGLSQKEAAERSGVSRVAYRNIENGNSIPNVSTLQNIADGLDVKLQDLFIPVRTLKKVRFRAYKRMNNRDHILTEVVRWLEDYNYLEEVLQENADFAFAQFEAPKGPDRAKKAAIQARDILGLNKKEPIHNIAGLLESNGIKLYPISIASNSFFGLSVSPEEVGPAIIVNVWDRISVERWIFTTAHELGHLLLHLNAFDVDITDENEEQENEANIFASYFLMPEHAFKSEWKNTVGLNIIDRVFKVKRIFRVSYKTVLYRLSEKQGPSVWPKFQHAYKLRFSKTLAGTEEPQTLKPNTFQYMPEALRSKEPDSLSPSDFKENRLSNLVQSAIQHDEITMSRGAEILGLDLEDMRDRVFAWD